MSDEFDHFNDAWDDELFGRGAESEGPYTDRVCQRCGARDLHWTGVNGRWRLADDDGLHDCVAAAFAKYAKP